MQYDNLSLDAYRPVHKSKIPNLPNLTGLRICFIFDFRLNENLQLFFL